MAPTPSDPAVTAGPAAQRPGRLSGLPALLLVVGIWAFAGVATIAITVLTSVGPVLIVLGPSQGVHAGDVVAGGLCALAALAATIEVLRHR
jgi:hypothetical protein